MSYTTLTQHNSPNYTPNAQVRSIYGMNRSISGITIHWWGDPNTNPSFEGVISWLCQSRAQAGCHPVVTGTGKRAAWLVNAEDAAWHAGNATGNATTIGIEADPRCRNEDYDTLAEVVADLWIAYGKLPLYPHKHWKSTACPGNYDLNRIKREAEAWYTKKTNPTPEPPVDTTPEWKKNLKKWATVKTMYAIDDYTPLRNLASTAQVVSNYKKGTPFEIAGETKVGNYVYYLTKYSIDKGIGNGFDTYELQNTDPNVVVPPPQPEWIRNLKDITDVKLSVLKADGAKVYNLNTLAPVNATVIPRDTVVDIAKETTVGNVKYYISNYSTQNNIANGILASDLGVPVKPPVNDKPEWLENLEDIADVEMYTRSQTPVLKLEDGTVTRSLPINTKVKITHATEIVGKSLLVVEGQTEAIEVLYLSDKPIVDPTNDTESRLSALEAMVKKIVDFLSSIFTNFKK